MNLLEIIRKAAAGEPLSEQERSRLADYQPADTAELEQRNRELETRLEELELRALSEPEQVKRKYETEVERLRTELTQARHDGQAAREELEKLQFRREIERSASREGFTDVDYFEYLCRKSEVDPADAEAMEQFVNALRTTAPRFFRLEVVSGAAEPAPDKSPATVLGLGSELAVLLAEAPSVED